MHALPRRPSQAISMPTLYTFPFYLLLFYLLFEYGRPQSFLPGLGYLHIPMFIQIMLLIYLINRKFLFDINELQTKLFLSLIALMSIHVLVAINNYHAFDIWRSFVLHFTIFISISSLLNSFERIEVYINTWIVINIFGAIVGLLNGGMIPGSSFMGDENDFALVMDMAFPFSYFMFSQANSKLAKLFYLAACGLFVAAAVTSFSRGGFLGLTAAGLYCLYKNPKKVVSVLLIGSMAGILFLTAPAAYWERIGTIKNDNIERGTGEARWYIWKIGFLMFLHNPVIGVGPENFAYNAELYELAEDLLTRPSVAGRAVHSLYVTLLCELGILGTLLYATMIYLVFRHTQIVMKCHSRSPPSYASPHSNPTRTDVNNQYHKLKLIVCGIRGAMIAYLVAGAFLSITYYPHFWILAALTVACKNVVLKIEAD